MIPNGSSTLITSLAWMLPVGVVFVLILGIPSVRKSLEHRATKAHAYFFHPSERPAIPGEVADVSEAKARADRSPLEQIAPAGWDYDIYGPLPEDADTTEDGHLP